MISFTATLRKFGAKGEKTGWTFIDIPPEQTDVLSQGRKTAFRVKGRLDSFGIQQVALVPMGDSANEEPDEPTAPFIMAVNATMRQGIGKEAGDTVQVELERDDEPPRLSPDLLTCLTDAPESLAFFETLTPGHQLYFSNWIESAKTLPTKTKRLHQAVVGLSMKLSYSEMIRHFRNL
ncbi:YdeI/OmpD-associated family protein [Spirosoma rhododendri]|uniref:DUF1905 domain-containing protein n=1 Tax=Spirosoma rhododendri TaxID=2728024 RepID=A0A7L5DU44_9BACT|nr:YdeI/OmpD-associated family protein [Spirosoma rhododendri]QJD81142.1 DUF1905 domain-containing protein [Spirosoma rhododendri]